jgi:hypothetical protein
VTSTEAADLLDSIIRANESLSDEIRRMLPVIREYERAPHDIECSWPAGPCNCKPELARYHSSEPLIREEHESCNSGISCD